MYLCYGQRMYLKLLNSLKSKELMNKNNFQLKLTPYSYNNPNLPLRLLLSLNITRMKMMPSNFNLASIMNKFNYLYNGFPPQYIIIVLL